MTRAKAKKPIQKVIQPEITPYNPVIGKTFIEAVSKGNYTDTALRFSGLKQAVLSQWLKAAERAEKSESVSAEDKPFVEFAENYTRAQAYAEMQHVATITNASKRNWNCSAWWLERTQGDKYAKHDKADVRHTGNIAIKIGFDDEFED